MIEALNETMLTIINKYVDIVKALPENDRNTMKEFMLTSNVKSKYIKSTYEYVVVNYPDELFVIANPNKSKTIYDIFYSLRENELNIVFQFIDIIVKSTDKTSLYNFIETLIEQ